MALLAACAAQRAVHHLRPQLVRPGPRRADRRLLRGGRLDAGVRRNQRVREQLARNGAIVAKFWLQISKEEQLRRFKEREKTRFKQFKITEEDWRNRGKWNGYQAAAADMIERTSTAHAPWTLVGANDKYHARIKVLETLVRAVEG